MFRAKRQVVFFLWVGGHVIERRIQFLVGRIPCPIHVPSPGLVRTGLHGEHVILRADERSRPYDGMAFSDLLTETLGRISIENLEVPFAAVCCDLESGVEVVVQGHRHKGRHVEVVQGLATTCLIEAGLQVLADHIEDMSVQEIGAALP